MALFLKEVSQKEVDIPQQATVIRISTASNGAPKEVTVFSNKKPTPVCLPSSSQVTEEASSFLGSTGNKVYSVPVNIDGLSTRSVILQPKQRIPRPPNAFMLFANDWRRKLAAQFPRESNKEISVRLGRMWKMMDKTEKDRYFQFARQVDAEHKKKFPDYVYNPKEARMRKALREQSRGERQQLQGGVAPPRWIKQPLSVNHRQAIVSPIMLAQQQRRLEESKTAIKEQVDWDNRMLQNFPDYLDLPYSGLSIPTNPSDYAIVADVDTQSWYPYLQSSAQSEMSYSTESKLPVDWSTQYNSDQQTFVRTSPQNSPFSLVTQQNVNNLVINGNHQTKENDDSHSTNCLTSDQKNQILSQSNDTVVKAEQQVADLLRPLKAVSENGVKLEMKQEGDALVDSGNKDILRLPGFHQAFGSTEIGRFSQHDGFFEAATHQPEPIPKVPTTPERNNEFQNLPSPSNFLFSPNARYHFMSSPTMWPPLVYCSPNSNETCTSSQNMIVPNFIDYSLLAGTDFLIQNQESPTKFMSNTNENSSTENLDYFTLDISPQMQSTLREEVEINEQCEGNAALKSQLKNIKNEYGIVSETNQLNSEGFEVQDLSNISTLNKPPVIISQNDKICVVLETSAIDSDIKEFASL